VQLSRRSLTTAIAASFFAAPAVTIEVPTYKPFSFVQAVQKAVIEKTRGTQRKRILRGLKRPLYGTRGEQSPVFGYQYAFGQCCGMLVASNSNPNELWATVELIYKWILENWEKVLRVLLSVLMFVVA
jgi:hypothetical protein